MQEKLGPNIPLSEEQNANLSANIFLVWKGSKNRRVSQPYIDQALERGREPSSAHLKGQCHKNNVCGILTVGLYISVYCFFKGTLAGKKCVR
jgi:hypothetical protein